MFCFLNKLARSFQFFYFNLFIETLKFEKEQYKNDFRNTFSAIPRWQHSSIFMSAVSPLDRVPLPSPAACHSAPEAVAGGLLLLPPVEGQKPISCNTSDFCWSSQSRGFRGERPVWAEIEGKKALPHPVMERGSLTTVSPVFPIPIWPHNYQAKLGWVGQGWGWEQVQWGLTDEGAQTGDLLPPVHSVLELSSFRKAIQKHFVRKLNHFSLLEIM